jgi:hypothetical protein
MTKEKKTTIEPTKMYKSPDGTIRYVKNGQLHNWDGPALIPEGIMKKGEYFIYGIPYTKDKFEEIKKTNIGLPWYKQASHKGGDRG